MKLFKRSGMYKAANVTFDPKSCEARSYAWWSFVRRIRGQVVFNDFRYSVSTAKHQRKVRGLMRELGIKVDRYVQVADGLQNVDTLKALNAAERETLNMLKAAEEAKRLRRNARARERRKARLVSKVQPVALELIQGEA